MRRLYASWIGVSALLVLCAAPPGAFAQTASPHPEDMPPDAAAPMLTAPALPPRGAPRAPAVAVPRTTTPPQPGAAQPTLPGAAQAAPPKPGSPVVEEIVRRRQPALVVRKEPRRRLARTIPRRSAGRHPYRDRPIDRPALAGVELVAPLPAPGEPPHIVVPTPAYPLESFAAAITTPPPPIRCHPTRRDPYAPDARLAREVPVQCEPDIP